MQAFGKMLLLDCYQVDKNKLNSISAIYEYLDELPNLLGMHKIIQPYVFKYIPSDKDKINDWGISGVVLITESHCSLHSFPEKNFCSIDIFSCCDFDSQIVIDYTKEIFNMQKFEINQLERGLEFPRNINLVKNIVTRQRTEL